LREIDDFSLNRALNYGTIPSIYFFDIGVVNILSEKYRIEEGTELFGNALEHLVFCEIRALLSYSRDGRPLTFWRDRSGRKVDFLIGDTIAVEVRGTKMVQSKHLKGLKVLSEEIDLKHKIVVSLDPAPRTIDGIRILPWKQFFQELWDQTY